MWEDSRQAPRPMRIGFLLIDAGMFLFAKLVTMNLLAQPTRADYGSEMSPGTFPDGLGQA